MTMNLKTISFIFIIGLTLSYQDDVVTTADEDSEINAKSLLSEELPNENEEVGKESTDVKNDEPNTDVEIVKPPALNAQRAKFYAAPGEGLGHLVDFDYDSNYDSLTSRFAPKPADLNHYHGIPHILTEARLKEIREPLLYWFFDKGGSDGNGDFQTDIHSSIPQVHKNFNFQVPFFGFRFNYTRVSMNGYLEFSDPPPYYKYPLVFPIKDWPKQNDPSFIGIFFSKCRIGAVRPEDVDQRAAGVYYRVERDLQSRTDTFGTEVRERVMWDIRTGVIGSETFIPKHVVIVTWKNMTFAGGIENTLYKTNTFQMVLATDEVFTYVLFNYADLQWSAHTEAGGDTTGGEGGIPAFIGFNAGNGTQSFSYEPYSQNSVLRDLVGRGWGNGKRGRHIFRIDEKIMLGTCNKDWSGSNLPLIFAPESGNMLGGTVVNITGPCFEDPNIKIICRFDTEEVRGFIIDRNRAICIQPRIFAEGYIRFEVALGSGGYNWKGKYFVETPATATERIFFESGEIHKRDANEFKITWDPKNLTTNQNAIVRISLWGYREISIKPELEYIDIIEESTSNAGVYLISPSNFRLRDNRFQRDMYFGFIQINLTNPDQYSGMGITPVLWSRPIPLGWYFKPQWEKQYGRKWPEALCNKWLMNDRYLKNFAHEIPQCPCKLSQALNDKGRFLPDFDCDKDINSKCLYNKGAIHCVRTGAPSLDGAEQQCCYDKHNYLMLSYDQQWGSRPRRSHNLGYIPWTEANKVPTLSHWFHDMSPFYSCCMWQDEQSVGCETYRFERRPSQDCIAYQAPGVATTFGDPHFVTFDNLPYTFNGKGEFVLVRSNSPKTKLDVQGRFEQIVPNRYGEVKATQLSSVVARGNNSAVIEVRLRPRDAQWRYRLDVLADGKRVYFDRPSLKVQHFVGVTVYTPTYILNQSEVILMFESGAGVEVIENEGFMTTRVYLPWNFINKTRGLFGNWSFDPQDDFTNPDGTFAAVGNLNSFERIHKDFAINWLLEDKEDELKGRALFTREFGLSASVYANRTFEPEWKMKAQEIIPTNRSYEIEKAKNLCSDNYQCEYDYAVTLNRDMAHFTKNYFNTYTKIRQESEERVISCGILETPRFGRKSNFLFIPGTKVAFECNQDFILIGDQRRTCLPDGQWDLPEYGYTECLRHVEYDMQQARITAAIILSIMLPMLFILGCAVYCIRKNYTKDTSTSWQFAQTRTRSLSRLKMQEVADDESRLSTPLKLSVPVSEHDSALSSNPSNPPNENKKHRLYDKSYRTHEPLEGKPNVDFEDRIWDIDYDLPSPISSNQSDIEKLSTVNHPSSISSENSVDPKQLHKMASIDSDSDYVTVEGTLDSTYRKPRDNIDPFNLDNIYASVDKRNSVKKNPQLVPYTNLTQQKHAADPNNRTSSVEDKTSTRNRPISTYSAKTTLV